MELFTVKCKLDLLIKKAKGDGRVVLMLMHHMHADALKYVMDIHVEL